MRARWFLALVAVAAIGCKKPAAPPPKPEGPPPPVEIVEVRVQERGEPPQLDATELARAAATALHDASGLRVDGPDTKDAAPAKRPYRLRIDVSVEDVHDAPSKKGVLRALVKARAIAISGGAGELTFSDEALAEKPYVLAELPDSKPALAAHARRAISDLMKGLGARMKLTSGDPTALAAALEGKDEEQRDEAMRIAADRKERAVVPQLITILKRGDDRALRDRALGALATIGDPRAVRPLTEVARFDDTHDLPKVLDALAAIGGPEARSYLEFVASGHESSEIQDMAKNALKHLDERSAPRPQ